MTSGHGEKLTRKQEAVIAALLTCRTLDDVAEAAGVAKLDRPELASTGARVPDGLRSSPPSAA